MNLFNLFAKISLDDKEYKQGISNAVKTTGELKSEVMKLAHQYKKEGMSMSEAMKKAHSKIEADAKQAYLEANGSMKGYTSGTKKSLTDLSGTIGSMNKAFIGMGAAIGGVVGVATKFGMNFEAQMSKVGAISGASAKDVELLTNKAKEMGRTTKFSATESGQAFEYMAMA